MSSELFIGLMSGTSLDGIDAALVAFEEGYPPRLLQACGFPWPADLEAELRTLTRPGDNEIARLGEADAWAGEVLAQAALDLCARAGVGPARIKAIGSHGQTVRHGPHARHPYTVQIGDPSRLAELTGITTVADFRRRDMAAGGQGAPLAPAFHAAIFRHPAEHRAVLNLGGIANISLLPAGNGSVTGYDTGPGNRLLDDWIFQQRSQRYDARGAWAASGRVVPELLDALLADPYFRAPPPKSTGTEHFNLTWVERLAPGLLSNTPPVDVQATLAELTARSVADALERVDIPVTGLLLCGGGSHNEYLIDRLRALLPTLRIQPTSVEGVDPDWVEAMAFAWLARETLAGRSGNLPEVTGADGPRVLGGIYPA